MDDAHRPGRAPASASRARDADADARLDGARLLARLLDDAIPIPGTSYRIGIDPLLGLVPGIGDVLGAPLPPAARLPHGGVRALVAVTWPRSSQPNQRDAPARPGASVTPLPRRISAPRSPRTSRPPRRS